ncbi:hypothetical protein [Flavobacterium sp. HJJ]|uniref:hypothetical protein n=1 Tax=Flavobacterium sp. HJJ TaxID=2783792 RepID=UPI00188D4B1D|nr:hypothetical protein [Flavobacterium sp. HJJ]MBF4473111.1 hypothetical protein [Flavobacterium sp. HJJ]
MKTVISYHPISEKEIHNWYYNMDFSLISDDVNYSMIKTARAEKMNDESLKKYIKTMKQAVKTDSNAVFDSTHGFFIATIQNYFRQSFIVNVSFSRLIEQKEYFKEYTKPWEEILEKAGNFTFLNSLTTDTPSSGIYIPLEKVVELLNDYNGNLIVKKDIDDFFEQSNAKAFIESLNYAKENNTGLLEANGILKLELSIENDKNETLSKPTKAIDESQGLKDDPKSEVTAEKENKEKKSLFSRVFGSK